MGVSGSPAAWRLLLERAERLRAASAAAAESPAKTEAIVSGQLALAMSEERVVAAAVWETLPVEASAR